MNGCSTAPVEAIDGPTTVTTPREGPPGVQRIAEPLRRWEASDLADDFLHWWKAKPHRAAELAGPLPDFRELLASGRQPIASWNGPMRDGDGWRADLLLIAPGRTILHREGSLHLSSGEYQKKSVRVTLQPVERANGLEGAVEVLERYVDVPVVLPPLPSDFRFLPGKTHASIWRPGYGFLAWRAPDGRRVTATYGSATLHRCGGGPPQVVEIGSERGLSYSHGPRVTVVWPASPKHGTGSYGLQGKWDLTQLLAWARAMQRSVEDGLSPPPLSGC